VLTPEMLNRKILMVSAEKNWGETIPLYTGYLDPINVYNGLGTLYGGIDFKDNTRRLRDLNGFMLAIQERMSYDVGCEATMHDFLKPQEQRIFFDHISLDETLNIQADAIRTAISKIIWTLWGQQLNESSNEVTLAYDLFLAIYDENMNANADFYNCHEIRDENRHVKMAFAGVMTYLLSDYRFNKL